MSLNKVMLPNVFLLILHSWVPGGPQLKREACAGISPLPLSCPSLFFCREQDISPLPRPSSRNKSRKHTEALQKLRCWGWGPWLQWRRAAGEGLQPHLSQCPVRIQGSEQASPGPAILPEPQAAPESNPSERR